MTDSGQPFDIDLEVDPKNVHTTYYFTGAMAGLVVFFTLWYWSRRFSGKYGSKPQSMAARIPITGLRYVPSPDERETVLTRMSRFIQRFTIRKVPGFPSAGHGALVFVYVVVNIVLLFTNIDWDLLSNFGRRLGW